MTYSPCIVWATHGPFIWWWLQDCPSDTLLAVTNTLFILISVITWSIPSSIIGSLQLSFIHYLVIYIVHIVYKNWRFNPFNLQIVFSHLPIDYTNLFISPKPQFKSLSSFLHWILRFINNKNNHFLDSSSTSTKIIHFDWTWSHNCLSWNVMSFNCKWHKTRRINQALNNNRIVIQVYMYEWYEANLTLLIALSYMVRVCQGPFEGLYLMYLQNMRISSFLSLMANRKFISECYSQCR